MSARTCAVVFAAALAWACGGSPQDQRCEQTQDGRTICVETQTEGQALVCETWVTKGHVDCWAEKWAKVDWGELMRKAQEPVITVFPVPGMDSTVFDQPNQQNFWPGKAINACEECVACTHGERTYGDYVCGLYCRGCGS